MSRQSSMPRKLSDVTMPIVRRHQKWGRNWPCLCGSGRKYKKCCLNTSNDNTDEMCTAADLYKELQS